MTNLETVRQYNFPSGAQISFNKQSNDSVKSLCGPDTTVVCLYDPKTKTLTL